MTSNYHQNALPVGSMIQEFRVEGVLGVGSFGIVYRARNNYFDEVVAIKEFLPSQLAHRADDTTVTPTSSEHEEMYQWGLKKFVNEAKLLWELSRPEPHHSIIRVSRFHEAHGTAYMVMDFEEGEPLSDLLRRKGTLNQEELASILYPLLDGLERVHAKQVFHRDIKPPNVLIRPDHSPVLIDFGAARWEAANDGSSLVSILTPEYAAPEQSFAGGEIGAWTDIYALAATAYRAITGDTPSPASERVLTQAEPTLRGEETTVEFADHFLWAIEAGLALRPEDRPRDVAAWRMLFEGQGVSPGASDDDATIMMSAPRSRPSDDVALAASAGAAQVLTELNPASAAGKSVSPTQLNPTVAAASSVAPTQMNPTIAAAVSVAPTRINPTIAARNPGAGERETAGAATSPGRSAGAWVGIALVVLLAGGVAGWYFLEQAPKQPGTEPSVVEPRREPTPEDKREVAELVEQLAIRTPREAAGQPSQSAPAETATAARQPTTGDVTVANSSSGETGAPRTPPIELPSVPTPSARPATPATPLVERPVTETPTRTEIQITQDKPVVASVGTKATDPIPQAANSLDRVQVLSDIQTLTSSFECQSIDARWLQAGEPVLELAGVVGEAGDAARLRTLLDGYRKQGLTAELAEVRTVAPPFCKPIAVLGTHAGLNDPTRTGPGLVPNKASGHYYDGEIFKVTVSAPASGYLYLDYMDPTGTVYRLLPSADYPDNTVSQGTSITIGDRDQFEASEPHGTNLVIAISSARPLAGTLDLTEGVSVGDYVQALRTALDKAGAPGALTANYVAIKTEPR